MLVTSGRYAHIRHPIYTGALIALVGNALALSLWWFVAVAAGVAYFTFAATQEEETMAARFPREYAEYRGRTKMLVHRSVLTIVRLSGSLIAARRRVRFKAP